VNLEVQFHPLVRAEIQEAHDWYERQHKGLGNDFLNHLEQALQSIAGNPAAFGVAWRQVRAGLVKRFPYVIYFRLLPNQIRIIAVVHAARDPSVWKQRLG
jgi:plasmid stabilization system protein ParE